MQIETVEDLVNKLADMIGVYGACKSQDPDGCIHSENNICCCRVSFSHQMEERIREAVENDKKLEAANLKP